MHRRERGRATEFVLQCMKRNIGLNRSLSFSPFSFLPSFLVFSCSSILPPPIFVFCILFFSAFSLFLPACVRATNGSFQKFKDGVNNILVCTNVASRGLEVEDVQHVIMFDFPQTLADYLHRCGRTARGGEMGRVTLLFAKRNLPLIQQIQNASRAAVCPPELR